MTYRGLLKDRHGKIKGKHHRSVEGAGKGLLEISLLDRSLARCVADIRNYEFNLSSCIGERFIYCNVYTRIVITVVLM